MAQISAVGSASTTTGRSRVKLSAALTLMTREEIHLHGAGRTDAGVHAEGMVAHFTTGSTISCHIFLRGLNAMLPGAIRILDAVQVDLAFHARFSAIGKRYQYIVYTGKNPPTPSPIIQCACYGSAQSDGDTKLPADCLKAPMISPHLKIAAQGIKTTVQGGERYGQFIGQS